MTALTGCGRKKVTVRYLIKFAFVTGVAVAHALRIGKFHGVRHMRIVHNVGRISIRRNIGFIAIAPGNWIVDHLLPFLMTASPVRVVTSETRGEISQVFNDCFPVAVLRVRRTVTLFTA